MGLSMPAAPPQRPHRFFCEYPLSQRRTLLSGLRFLVTDWPRNFEALCRAAKLTRASLTRDMRVIPAWYGEVVNPASRGHGCLTYTSIPLMEHLDLEGIARRRDEARSTRGRHLWTVLWHYYQQPEILPMARALGESWRFVARTVRGYNLHGPDWVDQQQRIYQQGRRRLLDPVQEQEFYAYLASAPGQPGLSEAQDWIEARIGHRPDRATIRAYRLGSERQTNLGRRARRPLLKRRLKPQDNCQSRSAFRPPNPRSSVHHDLLPHYRIKLNYSSKFACGSEFSCSDYVKTQKLRWLVG